jgi:hypothetical protein
MLGGLRSDTYNVYELKSIFQVYNNPLSILKVHFLKGETNALLHDLRGNRLMINVTKDNVEEGIKLGKMLVSFQVRYKVRDCEIACNPCPSIIWVLIPDSLLRS